MTTEQAFGEKEGRKRAKIRRMGVGCKSM